MYSKIKFHPERDFGPKFEVGGMWFETRKEAAQWIERLLIGEKAWKQAELS